LAVAPDNRRTAGPLNNIFANFDKTSAMLFLRTAVIGIIFGAVATMLNVPLPWMLGPLFGAAVLSLAGVKLLVPDQLRVASRVFVGLILGAAIDADTLSRVGQWPVSLLMMVLGMVLIITVSALYYSRVAKYDMLTAVTASLPGGLGNIAAVGIQLGARAPGTVIGQLLRVSIVVMLVPPLYMYWQGGDGADFGRGDGPLDWLGTNLWVCLLAVPAVYLGRLIRMPVPELLGPMIMAAGMAMLGFKLVLPFWLFAATFIVLGSAIGSRFYGIPLKEIADVAFHSIVATVLILGGTFFLALAIQAVTDVPLHVALLAIMPGGLAEMAILAAVLGVDPVFVTFHQAFRSVVLNSFAPFVLRSLRKEPPTD